MSSDDTLICFGGAVKALGNGKVGGYLVRFSGPSDPDLVGEYFTKATDFWLDGEPTRRVIYHHGFDETLELRKLGQARLKLDEVGIWAEAQLDLRDEYERKIEGMAQAGKLGWSSGSSPHLVRTRRVGAAKEILSWPITEATLTPTPAEPRAQVVPLKSLLAAKTLSEGETDQPDAEIKPGMHVRHADGCGEVKSIYDADADEAAKCTGMKGLTARVDMHDDDHAGTGDVKCYPVKDLEPMGGEDDDGNEAAKSLAASTNQPADAGSASFADHSREVVSAIGGYAERAEARLDARVKAGRELSAANRAEIDTVCSALESGVETLRAILDRTAPAADAATPGVEAKALLRLRAELLSVDQFLTEHAS